MEPIEVKNQLYRIILRKQELSKWVWTRRELKPQSEIENLNCKQPDLSSLVKLAEEAIEEDCFQLTSTVLNLLYQKSLPKEVAEDELKAAVLILAQKSHLSLDVFFVENILLIVYNLLVENEIEEWINLAQRVVEETVRKFGSSIKRNAYIRNVLRDLALLLDETGTQLSAFTLEGLREGIFELVYEQRQWKTSNLLFLAVSCGAENVPPAEFASLLVELLREWKQLSYLQQLSTLRLALVAIKNEEIVVTLFDAPEHLLILHIDQLSTYEHIQLALQIIGGLIQLSFYHPSELRLLIENCVLVVEKGEFRAVESVMEFLSHGLPHFVCLSDAFGEFELLFLESIAQRATEGKAYTKFFGRYRPFLRLMKEKSDGQTDKKSVGSDSVVWLWDELQI